MVEEVKDQNKSGLFTLNDFLQDLDDDSSSNDSMQSLSEDKSGK